MAFELPVLFRLSKAVGARVLAGVGLLMGLRGGRSDSVILGSDGRFSRWNCLKMKRIMVFRMVSSSSIESQLMGGGEDGLFVKPSSGDRGSFSAEG